MIPTKLKLWWKNQHWPWVSRKRLVECEKKLADAIRSRDYAAKALSEAETEIRPEVRRILDRLMKIRGSAEPNGTFRLLLDLDENVIRSCFEHGSFPGALESLSKYVGYYVLLKMKEINYYRPR